MQMIFIITISIIKMIFIVAIIESSLENVKPIPGGRRETYKTLIRIIYECKLLLERYP